MHTLTIARDHTELAIASPSKGPLDQTLRGLRAAVLISCAGLLSGCVLFPRKECGKVVAPVVEPNLNKACQKDADCNNPRLYCGPQPEYPNHPQLVCVPKPGGSSNSLVGPSPTCP